MDSELLRGILAQALEHGELRGLVRPDGPPQQALVDQRGGGGEDVHARLAAQALGRLEGPAADEDRQAPEQRALGRRKQVIAPGDGRAQRAVPRREVVRAAGEQEHPLPQAGRQLPWCEQLQAGRGQLEGEGEAVEPHADLRHGPGIAGGDREVRQQ
jgi:hypothetical protein